ncbi:MAG: Ig-like domain-containing protein [Burkholderiales bacterium]|nr:Ig-like domain-containing protein [Burkholderiales bacterium]
MYNNRLLENRTLKINSQNSKIIFNFFIFIFLAVSLISCGGSCPSYNPTNAVVFMDNNDGGVANGATNVSRTPSIVIGFQYAVEPSTVNGNAIYLSISPDGTNPIALSNFTSDPTNKTFNFNPVLPLDPNIKYYVIVKDDVKFVNVDAVPNAIFNFTTGSTSKPMVSVLSPLNGTNNNSRTPAIQFKFSELVTNVDPNTVKLLDENGNEVPVGNIVAGSDNTFTVSPLNVLNLNTKYRVVLDGVTNIVGNSIDHTEFIFITGTIIVPSVAILSPSNNAESVSQSPLIQFKFSEQVTNVDHNAVKILDENGNEVPVGNIVAGDDNTFTVNPLNVLNLNTKYKVVINGVTDLYGNSISQGFNFATGSIISPTVAMLFPSDNDTGVAVSESIQLLFSDDVQNVNSTNVVLRAGSPNGSIVDFNIQKTGNSSYAVVPNGNLLYDTQYYLILRSGITSVSNNAPLHQSTFTFTTTSLPVFGLSPQVISNLTLMTFSNYSSEDVDITSIETDNPNIILSPNGNTCVGGTVAANGDCEFILNALNVTTDTPTIVTVTFSDGSSQTYNILAQPISYEANFTLDGARYVLISYTWGSGDFDIAAGFSAINPLISDFPLYTGSNLFTNCVGFFCLNDSISYNSNVILEWAGDNTQSGRENILIDTWNLPIGTASFNFAISGAWYNSLGYPSITTVIFETYPDGTIWNKVGTEFIPDTN